MKTLLSFAIVLTGLFAFAGPEDHIQNQKCYGLASSQGTNVDQKIPVEICFETVTVDLALSKVVIYSYFMPEIFADSKVISLIRNTEDTYKFSVSNVLFNRWNSGCGDGESITLFVSGQSDFNGEVNMNQEFKISVEQDLTNDTCHSQPSTTVYDYTLK